MSKGKKKPISDPRIVTPVSYPFRGVSRGAPYALHPGPEFCREALNVRSFDQLSDRMRGGPRAGTIKWHKDPVHSSDHYVQDLNSLIPFGSSLPYGTPDGPRAGDPGGAPDVPESVPPGAPWVPGLHGDGPWYVNPRKCEDDTYLGIWIEWGLLPMFLNAFVYNGVCYYVNPFDKLTDDPPAILLPGDPLLGSVRLDSCEGCSFCEGAQNNAYAYADKPANAVAVDIAGLNPYTPNFYNNTGTEQTWGWLSDLSGGPGFYRYQLFLNRTIATGVLTARVRIHSGSTVYVPEQEVDAGSIACVNGVLTGTAVLDVPFDFTANDTNALRFVFG